MTYQEFVNKDPLQGTKYDFPRDHVGFGRRRPNPEWPGGAKIVVSFVINYEEGAERTVLNGDSQSESNLWEQAHISPRIAERAVNVESDYDYGSRRGIWRLLDIFENFHYPVTVFAVGMAFEKNPSVVQAFHTEGHEIASHGYRWVDYHNMSPEEEKLLIHRQMDSLKNLTGEFPQGWYYGRLSPHSKALVHEVYQELATPLLWEADSYADDLPYWVDVPAEEHSDSAQGMLMIPYTYDCNDLKYCVPHGWGSVGAFTEYLKNTFDTLYAEGLNGHPAMMTVGLHCRISGKPGRSKAVQDFVGYISSKEGVWVARRRDIASHIRKHFPYEKNTLLRHSSSVVS